MTVLRCEARDCFFLLLSAKSRPCDCPYACGEKSPQRAISARNRLLRRGGMYKGIKPRACRLPIWWAAVAFTNFINFLKPIIMFKNFIVKFPSTQNVYALINGELTACKVISVTADADKQKSFVLCESPDGFKNSFKAEELYSSVEAYKKGNTVSTIKPEFISLLPGCREIAGGDDEGDLYRQFYWVMMDGEPTKKYIDVKRVEFDAKTRKATNIVLPAEFYGTRQECVKWNDITVVEKDGSKHVQKSVLRSLLLNDEQRALIDAARDALTAVMNAGLTLGYDHDASRWFALNRELCKDAHFEWRDEVTEEEADYVIDYNDSAIRARLEVGLPKPVFLCDCARCIIAKPTD